MIGAGQQRLLERHLQREIIGLLDNIVRCEKMFLENV